MPEGKRMARYRADSASYQAELINEMETDQVRWAITADQDVAGKAVIAGLVPAAWQEPEPGCRYQVADTVHTMNQTKAAFRLSIKREARPQQDLFDAVATPYAYHVVASHWSAQEKTTHEVLGWHNQRGQAENFHKEVKTGVGMEQLPCGDAGANAVFFRIGVLAYNRFIGFKRLALSRRMGGADDRDGALEAGAGGGANPAAMRGAWSCASCWRPRRSSVGTRSASGAGRWVS
jgi:hypothetical protein